MAQGQDVRNDLKVYGNFTITGIVSLGDNNTSGDRTIQSISSSTNSNILLQPQGTGTIKTPSGYDLLVSSNEDLVNLAYSKKNSFGKPLSSILQSPGSGQDGYSVVWDNTNTQFTLAPNGGGVWWNTTGTTHLSNSVVIDNNTVPGTNLQFNFLNTGGTVPSTRFYQDNNSISLLHTYSSTYQAQIAVKNVGGFAYSLISASDTSGGGKSTAITISSNGNGDIILSSSFTGFKGLQESADYSAGYVALSLINKTYGDSHVTGKGISATLAAPGSGQNGYVISWDNASGKFDLTPKAGGSGVTVFTGLTDVPNSYIGQGLKGVRVNVGETGLEFYTVPAGTLASLSDVNISSTADTQLLQYRTSDNKWHNFTISGDISISNAGVSSVTWANGYTTYDARYLKLAGGTLTGALILNADPITGLGAATKSYVDNLITGLTWKNAVQVATTGNISLTGEQTIDGYTTSSSRVLVRANSTQTQNGIYISSSGAWTRSTDADTGTEIVGATVYVENGTLYGGTQWSNNNTSITLGSTNITFVQIAGVGTYTNGSGITLTGNVFSISSSAITNSMLVNSAITIAGTSTSLGGSISQDTITGLSSTGLIKRTGANILAIAVANTDYLAVNNPAYTGTMTTGTLGYSDTGILYSAQSTTNSYNQIIIQNTNTGATASTNFLVSNNSGTSTTFYGEFGMNSSGFTGSGAWNIASAVYLDSISSDLAIGTLGNNTFHIFTNSSTTDRLSIDGTGVFTFNSPVNGSTWNGTWTASANNQTHLSFSGSFTSRNIGTDNLFGYVFNPTLIVNAGNPLSQKLVAVRIKPTFSNSSGATTYALSGDGDWLVGDIGATADRSIWINNMRIRSSGSNSIAITNNSIGYGITLGSSTYEVNSPGTLTYRSQASNQNTFFFGDQSNNSTTARIFALFKGPVSSVSTAYAPTSGASGLIQIGNGATGNGNADFQPSSGTATHTTLTLADRINQTGTASGAITYLDINPSIASILGTEYGILLRRSSALNGFGTATPTATLQVNGAGTNPTLKTVGAGTGTNYSQVAYDSTGTNIIWSLQDNGQIVNSNTFTATANNYKGFQSTQTLVSRSITSDAITGNYYTTSYTISGASIDALGSVIDYSASLTGGITDQAYAATTSSLASMAINTYTSISAASTSGSGTGAVFTIVVSGATTFSSVTVTTAGSGYKVGDTFTFNGSQFGGGTGSRVYTISGVTGVSLATGAGVLRLKHSFVSAISPKFIDFVAGGTSIGSISGGGGNISTGSGLFFNGPNGTNVFSVVNGQLTVSGAAALTSTFSVTGAATLSSTVSIGNAVTSTYSAVNGNAAFNHVATSGTQSTSLNDSSFLAAYVTVTGRPRTVGSIVGGSGYTNGTYNGVAATGGTGTGLTLNVTVSGGAVTAVVIANTSGINYLINDVVSVAAANIGGTGSGFTVTITDTQPVVQQGFVWNPSQAAATSSTNVASLLAGMYGNPTFNLTNQFLGTTAAIYYDPVITAHVGTNAGIVMSNNTTTPIVNGFGTLSPTATVHISTGALSSLWNPNLKTSPGNYTALTTATAFRNLDFQGATWTWVDGTVANQPFNNFAAFTVNKTTTSATFTDIYNSFFAKSIAGSGVTFTRNWSIGMDGNLQVQGSAYIGAATTAPTAFLHLAAGTTGSASLRIDSGVAPTSPNQGDFWNDGTNLFFRSSSQSNVVATNFQVAAPATTGTMTTTLTNVSSMTITPTGACTFNASGGKAGQECVFIITTSGTSAFVLTWGTNFKTTGTLSTGTVTAKVFTVSFIYDGTNWNEMCRTTAM